MYGSVIVRRLSIHHPLLVLEDGRFSTPSQKTRDQNCSLKRLNCDVQPHLCSPRRHVALSVPVYLFVAVQRSRSQSTNEPWRRTSPDFSWFVLIPMSSPRNGRASSKALTR